ncbi:MAG: GHKL domain-containing protein [Gammaproteobacteria bacterium]|nr:GHKL domain-containing protein [Gammaproteobacteria bacterium]
MRNGLTGWTRRRLAIWLGIFFLALAIPTAILINQAYRQLKYESFHQYRLLAEDLSRQIDRRLQTIVASESARSFTDYAFLNVAGDPKANFLQRSPLSAYPVHSALPGIIGYFQIDAQGNFTTPLLPQETTTALAYGVNRTELQQREALQTRLHHILSENHLVQTPDRLAATPPSAIHDEARKKITRNDASGMSSPAPASVPLASQQAFDQLRETETQAVQKQQKLPNTLGRIEDLKLKTPYAAKPAEEKANAAKSERRALRKERSVLPEAASTAAEADAMPKDKQDLRVHIFESQIDAFEISLLESGQFVMYRKVWRDGQRYIQGALIDPAPLFHDLIESAFRETALSQMSNIAIAYRGNVFTAFSGKGAQRYLSSTEQLQGALLAQTRLSAPWSDLELIFSVNQLPNGPGGNVLAWVAFILIIVLCGGVYLMYRLGVRQIELARQQQDFVSAVSHELKTPLTSIRMYGEILREGWADESKKRGYYDYIFTESERLSRLIGNVLQLARMTRHELQTDLKTLRVSELIDNIRSKVSSQIERAGFQLDLQCDEPAQAARIEVDVDFFTQILINLVDNALKFAARAEQKRIDIACRRQQDRIVFSVRDYGPGIPKDQLRKVFRLFYRANNELTRETVGTGIGLALVQQLATAMQGRVDVINRQPGVEFQVSYPVSTKA